MNYDGNKENMFEKLTEYETVQISGGEVNGILKDNKIFNWFNILYDRIFG